MANKLIFLGLIFLIVFTPLAFGTTQVWSIAVMEMVVLLLLLLYAAGLMKSDSIKIENPALLGLLLLFTLLVFIQAIPVPGVALSFKFLNFERSTASVYPHATLSAAIKMLSYLIIFFLVTHYFSQAGVNSAGKAEVNHVRRARVSNFVNFIIFFSFALAVFSLIQHFTFNGKIYWFKELTRGGAPFGPFINRNHYAGYMELTIPLALGLLFAKGLRADRWPLYLFMSGIMSTSLFLCLSRTGMVSFLCQLLMLVFLLNIAKGQRLLAVKNFLALGLIVLVLLTFVFWFGPEPVVNRIGTLMTNDRSQLYLGRAEVWLDTIQIFKDFPIAGSGLGTFPILHVIYKSLPTDAVYMEAHNDYLQILSETGVIGAALLLFFGTLAVARALGLLRRERDRVLVGVRAGALTGCFGILLHSITDFNLQIPANALLFFILVALATIPSHEGREGSERC